MVSVVLGNDHLYLQVFFALTRVGATANPLNPAYTEEEFRFYMEDSGARFVVVPPAVGAAGNAATALGAEMMVASGAADGRVILSVNGKEVRGGSEPATSKPEDVALFLHTSGTTSRPKGVPLTQANILASVNNIAAAYRLTADDRPLVSMPLFHVHGLIGVVLSTLGTGGTAILSPRFSASAFWPDALEHGATWYSGSPTIHQILLGRAGQDGARTGYFRFIRSCSATLTPTAFHRLESRFGSPVLEAYGMTEAAHQMASNPLPPAERRAGSVGRATGVQVATMDEQGVLTPAGTPGEVVIKGPNVMAGYRNNPSANEASFTNGWFRTGDQGLIDTGGYLTLVGRIKELINRGGEKIPPLEVDAVLAEHPAVGEAICFGVPDAKYGEEVHAAVVLKGEASPEEIQRFCRSRLADFKVPKVIHLTKELPRTPTGKIQRKQVAAQFVPKNCLADKTAMS